MVGTQETGFSCTCGQITGHVRNLSPPEATHAVCFCADCRAAEVYLEQPDPGTDGVHLVQLNASDIHFESGTENLAVMRIYPSGLLRWYAACCNAPLFNTVATPKVRFATLILERLDDPQQAGPVRARAFVPRRGGKTRHEHVTRMIWPVLVRSLSGLVSGDWRDTPFFDPASGRPIREPKILSQADRDALGLKPKTYVS